MTNELSNILAILCTIGLATCLAADLRKGLYRIVSGRTAVLVSIALWYLLEALQVPKELNKYTQGEYDSGLIELGLSVVVFLCAYHLCKVNLFAPLARRLPMLDQSRVLWVLVLGCMTIGIGSIVAYTGNITELFQGLTGMRARWTGMARDRYGSWGTLIYELQMFLQAAVPLAVALLFMKRAPIWQRWVAGTYLVWFFLRTFFSGSRTPLIPIVLALGAAIFFKASARWRRILVVAGLPVALIGGIFWSTVIVEGRNTGKFIASSSLKGDYVGFEMFRELLYVTRKTNDGMPLEWGMTYFTQLVNPVPRVLWPGKPTADAGLILAKSYGAVYIDKGGEAAMTVSPGFLGEAHLNFGYLGFLIVPGLAGIVVSAWDRMLPMALRSLPIFLVFAGGIAIIFVSGRSFTMSALYGMLSLFVLIFAFDFMGFGPAKGNSAASRAVQPDPIQSRVPKPGQRVSSFTWKGQG